VLSNITAAAARPDLFSELEINQLKALHIIGTQLKDNTQLVKKLVFYGTQRFIITFNRAEPAITKAQCNIS